ncbi:hypothetical protein [Nocardia jiangsuensis]|uniref:Uncharacterized protein n=1 Tax=Nocardia jiangsuensis TaxID=1691563 RepID=A0ABV8DNX8_9NOCA
MIRPGPAPLPEHQQIPDGEEPSTAVVWPDPSPLTSWWADVMAREPVTES